MGSSDIEKLADRLIEAHSATVEWLTTVLAEDALGGPAALQRTPIQAATGVAVKLVNVPMSGPRKGSIARWIPCARLRRRSASC